MTEHHTTDVSQQPASQVDAVAGSELEDTRLLTDPEAPLRRPADGDGERRSLGAPLIEWLEQQPAAGARGRRRRAPRGTDHVRVLGPDPAW